MKNSFRYFKTSPEIIRLAVMMYVRFPLSLRQVEDLLHERGIDVSHETVRGFVRQKKTNTNCPEISLSYAAS
jgi:transposase-like protein